jgi:thiamine phosphate synthase YjbQ (UPF0047 family)
LPIVEMLIFNGLASWSSSKFGPFFVNVTMPAHIKGALTQTQLSIPVSESKLTLGIYQGIYLFEHRRTSRTRELVLHLIGQ